MSSSASPVSQNQQRMTTIEDYNAYRNPLPQPERATDEARPPKRQMISPEQQVLQNNADGTENLEIGEARGNHREGETVSAIPAIPPFQGARKKKYSHPKAYSELLGYRFIETLGQGSMGKVKLAENVVTKERVAVKIIPRYPKEWTSRPRKRSSRQSDDNDEIPAEIEYDPSRELRILREAFTMRLLDHPLIVKCKDFVMTDDYYYLIFEYVPGKQLLDYIIVNGPLKENKARSILRQIISAVDYCHQNSIVHRDLKIENIVIDDSRSNDTSKRLNIRRKSDGPEGAAEPRIKLLDFGLANFYQKDRLLTTCCGSLYFAAPELLHAQKYVGPEVDIWSLGVIAYVLLCGKVPFDDGSLHVIHAKIKAGKIDYPPHLSHESVKFLKRLLCVNPKLRASMDEVKTHPWLQSMDGKTVAATTSSSHSLAIQEPPFLLSSLGDKFRYLTFGGYNIASNGSKEAPVATVNATTNLFMPKRVPLKNLPGHHPNPVIASILKRTPEVATSMDEPSNMSHMLYTTPTGRSITSPLGPSIIANSPQIRRNIHLSDPTSFGLGFDAAEVDEILRRALRSGSVQTNPVMSFYYLIHEWMQQHAGKPMPSRELSASMSVPSLSSRKALAAANSPAAPFMDTVPQQSGLYGSIYPRQISERALHQTRDKIRTLVGTATTRSPQELSVQFYMLLCQEGFRYDNQLQSGGFMSEWTWKPSVVSSNNEHSTAFRIVQFQLEWVEVIGDEKMTGNTKYGIRCMQKSGDADMFNKVWERISWRWEQWLKE